MAAAAVKLAERIFPAISGQRLLLIGADSPRALALREQAKSRVETFGTTDASDWQAHDIKSSGGSTFFKVRRRGEIFGEFELPLLGVHNVRNTLAAVAIATEVGIDHERIRAALKRFGGVKRRLEIVGHSAGVTVYDDFAHHPTAVGETLAGLRASNPSARIWAIFEPRSNTTRRAVFQQQLPEALQLADGVFIAQIAALEQIPAAERLDPKAVVGAIEAAGRPAFYERDAAAIVERITPLLQPNDVVTIFSNGGFDGIHEKLLERLSTTL
jgi:UDP-N-acetylmuramate: L-alanyl-gamma-D-glutamyl-meso-diaminopimelate ligase